MEDYTMQMERMDAVAKRDSPILGGLRTIEEAQRELWDRLMKLKDLLTPVLRDVDTPSLRDEEGKPVQNGASPLYVQLQNIHSQMQFMNDTVNSMIHKLDV